jgi:hypothetical protein
MKNLRNKISIMSIFMATLMLLISMPSPPVLAAMISTDTVMDGTKAQKAREYLKGIISRQEVQDYFISQGIDPLEAQKRVDSLSDSEAIELANHAEQLPPGGSALGIVVGAVVIVFLVLLITDILGYTDVFPFVKSQK